MEHIVVSKMSACVNLCANKDNEVYAMLESMQSTLESMQKKVDKVESDNLGLLITILVLCFILCKGIQDNGTILRFLVKHKDKEEAGQELQEKHKDGDIEEESRILA